MIAFTIIAGKSGSTSQPEEVSLTHSRPSAEHAGGVGPGFGSGDDGREGCEGFGVDRPGAGSARALGQVLVRRKAVSELPRWGRVLAGDSGCGGSGVVGAEAATAA
ncbi:hypothetical protein GCM10010341_60100 [Streptomyces noursei]|nr:hypothetical protein GCM10010341_60100 [Streptomyces noursei]